MPKPPIDPLRRKCLDKVRYSNVLGAQAGALRTLHRNRLAKRAMWAYRCDNCHGWHLTSHAPRDNADQHEGPFVFEDAFPKLEAANG